MRLVGAVILPWLLWGALDSGIYVGLGAAWPDRFPAGAAPASTGLLVVLSQGQGRVIQGAVGLLLLTGIVVQIASWTLYPVWYHVLFLLSIVPAALIGAKFGRGSQA